MGSLKGEYKNSLSGKSCGYSGVSHGLSDEINEGDENDADGIRTCDDERVRAAR